MKRYLYALAALMVAASCSRDRAVDDYGDNVPPFIKVDNPSFSLPGTTTDTTIALTSNVWWNIAVTSYSDGSSDWVTGITPSALNATRQIQFTMTPNLFSFARTATVTVSPKVSGATDNCVFTLTQAPAGPFVEVAGDEIDASGALNFGVVGGTGTINITANYDWTIDNTNAPWMTFTPSSGTADPYNAVPVTITYTDNPNAPTAYRDGSFAINFDGQTKVVNVHQDKEFAQSTLTVNNGETLTASWTPVTGTVQYTLEITNAASGTSVTNINVAPSTTTFDLGAYFAANPYSNSINVVLRATSASPAIYSESDAVATSPLFGNGSGDGSGAGQEYIVSALRHLQNVGKTADLLTKYYKMTVPFDLTGVAFTPIGSAAARFTGSFDGAGNTISNLTVTVPTTASFWGLFGVTGDHAVVKNIAFVNCKMTMPGMAVTTAPQGFGFAVGSNNGGTIDHITVKNSSIDVTLLNSVNGVGLIAGSNNAGSATTIRGTVSNCVTSTDSNINSTNALLNNATANAVTACTVGGIVGMGAANTKIIGCTNNASLSTRCVTGGIVGQNGSVESCGNTGTIVAASNVAGIVALYNIVSTDTIRWCYNTGLVNYVTGIAAYYFGGIVAHTNNATENLTIAECYNAGDVISTIINRPNVFGGILAYAQQGTINIHDCYNTGHISAGQDGTVNTTAAYAGGIAGNIAATNTSIANCYSTGKTDVGKNSANYAAGVVANRVTGTPATAILANLYFITGNAGGPGAPTMAWSGNALNGTGTTANVTNVQAGGWTDAQMRTQATFIGFDFSTVWSISGGYPQLINVPNPPAPVTVLAPRRW